MAESHSNRTLDERNAILMRVLYDMLVLSDAIKLMEEWRPKKRDKDRSEEQLALNAALLKMRVLYDFLYLKSSRFRDQVFARQVSSAAAAKIPPLNQYENSFRDITNKWCAHLSWDRVDKAKEYPTPERREAQDAGTELLSNAYQFVRECLNAGLKIRRTGREYLKRIKRNLGAKV